MVKVLKQKLPPKTNAQCLQPSRLCTRSSRSWTSTKLKDNLLDIELCNDNLNVQSRLKIYERHLKKSSPMVNAVWLHHPDLVLKKEPKSDRISWDMVETSSRINNRTCRMFSRVAQGTEQHQRILQQERREEERIVDRGGQTTRVRKGETCSFEHDPTRKRKRQRTHIKKRDIS